MADGRWRISVTPPDWGQDHLSLEAIVAFVDGELATGPQARATEHVRGCPECAAQVSAQRAARSELRTAQCPLLPSALLSTLRAIPQHTDLPAPPAGLAMTADGQLVSMARPEAARPEPVRPESVLFPSGPRSGLRADRSYRPEPPPTSRLPRPAPTRRRIGVGTGVAVSGLALGAFVFGSPLVAPGIPAPAPAADRSQPPLGGAPSMLDARLRLGPTSPTVVPAGEVRVGRLFR